MISNVGNLLFTLTLMLRFRGASLGRRCYERDYYYYYYYTYYRYCTNGCCGSSTYRYCCYYSTYTSYYNDDNDNYDLGGIIGGVIAAVIIITIVSSVIGCLVKKCKNKVSPARRVDVVPAPAGAVIAIAHVQVEAQNHAPFPGQRPPPYQPLPPPVDRHGNINMAHV